MTAAAIYLALMLFGSVVILTLLTIFLLKWYAQSPPEKKWYGKFLPWREWEWLFGAPKQDRPALLLFISPGCSACRRSLTIFNRLAEQFAEDDIFIGLVVVPEWPWERSAGYLRRWYTAADQRLPLALHLPRRLRRGLRLTAWPAAALIDGDGRIRHYRQGELAEDAWYCGDLNLFTRGLLGLNNNDSQNNENKTSKNK